MSEVISKTAAPYSSMDCCRRTNCCFWLIQLVVRLSYGLFTVSPFGEAAYTANTEEREESPVVVAKGQSLTLRYGMLVHDGDALEADVAGQYSRYAGGSAWGGDSSGQR